MTDNPPYPAYLRLIHGFRLDDLTLFEVEDQVTSDQRLTAGQQAVLLKDIDAKLRDWGLRE